jgi:hypothetical protein
VACFTSFISTDSDLRFRSKNRFLEFQSDVLAQIGPTLRATAAASTSTENVAEPEQITKNISEVLEDARIKSSASACGADSGMAIPVIHAALFSVGQNSVGLAGFFEFFFRVRVVRIPVRMVLQGQLAIGALDFLITRAARNTKNFIKIAF